MLDNFSKESLRKVFGELSKGKYKIITHERIKEYVFDDDIPLLHVSYIKHIGNASLERTQKDLLKNQCKNCTNKGCIILKQAKEITKMYYIKFEKN